MPTLLVALLLAALAVAPAAGLAAPDADQATSEARIGLRLPAQQGVRVKFSRILARSDGGPPAGAPEAAIAPGERPPPGRGGAGEIPAAPRRSTGARVPAPAIGSSFLATQISDGEGFIPPDSMGAVGPSQVMVVVNGQIRFFNKSGGLQFQSGLNSFFDSVRNGVDVADPHVRYDRLSGRWFVVAINVQDPSNRVLIAVSSGPTITSQSSFTFFSFGQPPADSALFADYPTLGVDRSALYIGTNNFDAAGDFVNTTGFVVRKADLLAGTLTVFALRNLGTVLSAGLFTPQGVQNDDPAATAGYFIGVDTQVFDQLDIVRIVNPGGTPSIPAGIIEVAVPSTTFPIGVPAEGTPTSLDAIDDRLFAAMIATDPVTDTPRLWTAHNIEVNSGGAASSGGGRDGSRWYEIANLAGTPTVVQAGTVFDPAASNPASYWMPSIAASGQGQAVIGTSFAGAGRFAGVAVAQRFQGDPPGVMGSPLLVQPGLGPYDIPSPPPNPPNAPQRWGDYSQTVVDPNDDMTFWTFQEYANATDSWGVRAIQVRARPPATPSTASPARIPAGRASVSVKITGTSAENSAFFDPGPDTGGPGFEAHIAARVGGGVKVNRITFLNPTHVILDLNTRRAGLGPKNVRITNPDGQAAVGRNVLVVVDQRPPNTTLRGPRRTTDQTPTFRFRSNEPGSRFKCKLDRRRFRRCRSPKTLRPLDPGVHVFKVKAIDRAGNVDPTPARRRFTILP